MKFAAITLLGLLGVLAGCEAKSEAPGTVHPGGWMESPEALSREITRSLLANDTAATWNLVVGGQLYDTLYSELPENDGQPETRSVMRFLVVESSHRALLKWMKELPGKGYTYVGSERPRMLKIDKPGLRAWSGASVTLRMPDGTERSVKLFNSMIERNGKWKVWSILGPEGD